MKKINIPLPANKIISTLNSFGYKGYVVGGFVRDALLGIVSDDIDITTDATPSQVADIFKPIYHTLPTGIKYGTMTVIVNAFPIQITTFRSETSYDDRRHPSQVKYEKTIEKDLSRRDFTINSIAYNDDEGIVDFYCGVKDLEDKIIRCVGNPSERFKEDALRMIRAVRFASKYKFSIEKNTYNSIKDLSHLINNISFERINDELTKMLLIDSPSLAINILYDTKLLEYILPEISVMYGFDQKNPYHIYDLFNHTLHTLDNTDPILQLRLAALFHDTGKIHTFSLDDKGIGHFYGHEKISEKITKKALTRLKYPKKIINDVCKLVRKHQINPTQITDKGIRRLINYVGIENILLLANLKYADSKGTAIENPHLFTDKVNHLLSKENVFTRAQLKVNGNDIQKLGLKGKNIGICLDDLMELVLENPEKNEKKILLNYAKANLSKYKD